MFVLTTKEELINTDRVHRIYMEQGFNRVSITASFGKYEDGDEMKIELDVFKGDEINVAKDVYYQLIFAIDGAPNDKKIINLAEMSKRAKYEYHTGMKYT